jgi:hypothetical protein
MAVRLIFEVMRRTVSGPVEVGSVTDDFLAKQVIDRLYEELRQVVLSPDAETMLQTFGFEDNVYSASQDWDTWSINNRNSPTPVFFARKRQLWNSVPSTIRNWGMGEVGDNFSFFPGDVPAVITAVTGEPTVTNG